MESERELNFDENFSLALLALKFRALLLGGVACNIYGSTRYSQDVDWWLDPSGGVEAWTARLMEVCAFMKAAMDIVRLRGHLRLGSLPGDAAVLPERVRRTIEEDAVVRCCQGEGMVDIFFAPHQLDDFEAAWQRAKPWDGGLRVLSIPDLIRSKEGTGRDKDKADIDFLRRHEKP
ncbi:MAG: hypothetical protein PHV34_00810 [Verrucomicrobiae bacterium]|nr:hypothetical protein [Verrucomicrobiae bacterium]